MLRRFLMVAACFMALALASGCTTVIGAEGSLATADFGGTGDSQDGQRAQPGTVSVVLRPVDATGEVATGFTVDSAGAGAYPVDCHSVGGTPARGAVDDDIFYCSPNADAAYACWQAANPANALCLPNPFEPVLNPKITQGGMGTVAAPAQPEPFGLLLADGTECVLRHGGAWGSHKTYPAMIAFYGCDSAAAQIVWSDDRNPIDDSAADWTVQVGGFEGPLTTVAVEKAYYVGMA